MAGDRYTLADQDFEQSANIKRMIESALFGIVSVSIERENREEEPSADGAFDRAIEELVSHHQFRWLNEEHEREVREAIRSQIAESGLE